MANPGQPAARDVIRRRFGATPTGRRNAFTSYRRRPDVEGQGYAAAPAAVTRPAIPRHPSARPSPAPWAMKPITGGPIRKPTAAPMPTMATPALGATPGARDATLIITGIMLAAPKATRPKPSGQMILQGESTTAAMPKATRSAPSRTIRFSPKPVDQRTAAQPARRHSEREEREAAGRLSLRHVADRGQIERAPIVHHAFGGGGKAGKRRKGGQRPAGAGAASCTCLHSHGRARRRREQETRRHAGGHNLDASNEDRTPPVMPVKRDDRRPQDGPNERPDAEKAMNRRHRRSAARLLDFRGLGVERDDVGAERRSEDERSHEQCRHAPGEDRDDAGGEECWEKHRHGRPRSDPRNERPSEQLRDDRPEPDVQQRKPEDGRIKLQPPGDRRNVHRPQRQPDAKHEEAGGNGEPSMLDQRAVGLAATGFHTRSPDRSRTSGVRNMLRPNQVGQQAHRTSSGRRIASHSPLAARDTHVHGAVVRRRPWRIGLRICWYWVDLRRVLLTTFSRRAAAELARPVERIISRVKRTAYAAETLPWARNLPRHRRAGRAQSTVGLKRGAVRYNLADDQLRTLRRQLSGAAACRAKLVGAVACDLALKSARLRHDRKRQRQPRPVRPAVHAVLAPAKAAGRCATGQQDVRAGLSGRAPRRAAPSQPLTESASTRRCARGPAPPPRRHSRRCHLASGGRCRSRGQTSPASRRTPPRRVALRRRTPARPDGCRRK